MVGCAPWLSSVARLHQAFVHLFPLIASTYGHVHLKVRKSGKSRKQLFQTFLDISVNIVTWLLKISGEQRVILPVQILSSKNSNSVICTIYGQKVTFVTYCSCNDSWYAFVTSTVIQHPFVDNLIGGIGYRLAIYGVLG